MEIRRPARKSVTISDVAQMAQVSRATAARALGGYGVVSEPVRARVLEAAGRLDYRANALARTMATGRSGTIGLIVGDIENSFFSLAVRGIGDCAKEAGFDLLLANSAEDLAAEKAAVDVLLSKGVDGLIVAPCQKSDRSHFDDVLARGKPLVLLDRDVPGLPVDVVAVDGDGAARMATEMLLASGHRRIAYVTTSLRPEGDDPADVVLTSVGDRIRGFLKATREAEGSPARAQIVYGVAKTEQAQAILRDVLTPSDRPTAILASDSKIALDVFRAAKHHGLKVPDDLSLATFDDADWMSALDPGVTVVAQPTYELGYAAADRLVARIGNSALPPRRLMLEAKPILRASVRRPMPEDPRWP